LIWRRLEFPLTRRERETKYEIVLDVIFGAALLIVDVVERVLIRAIEFPRLKPEQVFINTLAAGGTFGRRANAESDYIAEAVSIAKATDGKYPVKVIWTREDDITGGRYRPATYHHVTAGLSQDGKLIAVKQDVVNQSIMAGTPMAGMIKDGVDPTSVEGGTTEQYDVENAHVTWTQAKVGVPILWWRSVGHTHTAYAKEVLIDELAQAAGKDPVAYRLSLLDKNPRQAAVLKLAAQNAGWDKSFPNGQTGPNGARRGRGVAIHESFGSVVAHVAEVTVNDGTTYPPLKQPKGEAFEVRNIFTDFKRHDVGPNFYERNWDGSTQTQFLTRPLWGVGSTGPYGHDGRSITLNDVILRHAGEAKAARDKYAASPSGEQAALQTFLNSLVLFPPDDTASSLDPGDPTKTGFPQYGHGSIKLTVLFNDPTDPE